MKKIPSIVFLLIALCSCKPGEDRDRIQFRAGIDAVRDSLVVAMKFMDKLRQENQVNGYGWDWKPDNGLYFGNQRLAHYTDLYIDTLSAMKGVPFRIRSRFVNLILYLRREGIEECGWSQIANTWMFNYRRILIDRIEDDRWIVVRLDSLARLSLQEDFLVRDEISGLVLMRPDRSGFKARQLLN